MNQNAAKAFLAIIIALVVFLTASILFSNDTLETHGAPIVTPQNTPVPEQEPEPENPKSGTGTASGSSSGSKRGHSGSSAPTTPQQDTPPAVVLVATSNGIWGIANTPEPISLFSANVYAYAATASGELIDRWIEISGSYQGHAIYIKFSIEQATFEGYLSFQQDFKEKVTITGSFWKESQDPGMFISYFLWGDTQYWIYGSYPTAEGMGGRTQDDVHFEGYWGNVAYAEPLSWLDGSTIVIPEYGEDNHGSIWLALRGDYVGHPISIRFPILNSAFDNGYAMLLEKNAVDIQSSIITGSLWHVESGTGNFIVFFTWQGNNYWIFGQGYNLA